MILWAAIGLSAFAGRLDDFEVWLDDPASARVTVDALGGRISGLEPGEQARALQVSGHSVRFAREDGLRIECDTCYGPMILVGPTGKLQTTFDADALDYRPGEALIAYRPYFLAREMGWERSWLGDVWYHEHSEAIGLGIGADWAHVARVEAMRRPPRAAGWLLLAVAGFATAPAFALMGEPETLPYGAAALAGVGTAGWVGVHLATKPRRKVVVYERGG